MVHRVEPGHAGDTQGNGLCRRQRHIDGIEYLGGAAHTGYQLGLDGAGAFGLHQIACAVAQTGHQGQKQHQHAHAAHPLGLAAPEQDAGRQRLHSGQNGSAGGGQTRGRFKQGVHIGGDSAGEGIGQSAEYGQHHPAQGHSGIAVTTLHPAALHLQQLCGAAQQRADDDRCDKDLAASVAVVYAQQQRQQKKTGLHPQHIAYGTGDQSNVHEKNTSFSVTDRQLLLL